MTKYLETTGKTEELAIAAALAQLGLERDDVSVEVLARAKTGFLGIGSAPAKVRVSYEVPDPAPTPVPEKKAVEVPQAAPVAEKRPEPAAAAKEPEPQQSEPVSAAPAQKSEASAAAPKKSRRSRSRRAPREEQPKAERVPEQGQQPAAAPAEPAPDRTEQITAFLTGLMEHLEVQATPVIRLDEQGTYEVELVGENLGALIGRRGETLDAIQQLTNYAVNHGQSRRVRIHVDCEHYRAKREESLQRLARKTADKAVKYRRNMMLEPMNAYERHVIHAELQEYHPNISTYSTGTEPNRRIVVAYNR